MKGKPEILNTAISQMEAWRYSVISLEQLAGQYQKILLSVPARRLTKRACSAAWYMRCGRGRVWQKYGPSWRRLFIFLGAPVKNMRILRPIRLLSCLRYGISVRLMWMLLAFIKWRELLQLQKAARWIRSLLFRRRLLILPFSARISRKYRRAVWLAWILCFFLWY